MRRIWRGVLAGAVGVLAIQPAVGQWSSPVTVSNDATLTGGNPELAVSTAGHWILVWERASNGAALYSRSTNRGKTWGAATTFAPIQGSVSQGAPSIASDLTSGTFLAAWQTGGGNPFPDTTIARTAPAQATFPSVGIVGQNNIYFGMAQPVLSGSGANTWVLAGVSSNAGATDEALQLFRSTNNGSNWAPVAALGRETTAARFDRNADIASDGNGASVLVTESRVGSVASPSSTLVRFSRSNNNGETWSNLATLDSGDAEGIAPRVAASAAGRFLVLLRRGNGPGNLLTYSSENSGSDWSTEVPVNSAGISSSIGISGHDIAVDNEGNAVAVWSAQDPAGTRNRLFFATSRNFGASWTSADYMTTPTTDVSDEAPVLQYDGQGRWAAAWQRRSFGTSTTLSLQSATLVFPIRADLSVTQRDTPDPATVGDVITYNMTVRNDGPSSATGVQMINHPPAGAELLTVTQTKGTRTETSGTIVFNFGEMNEGSSASGEITVRMAVGGVYRNSAEVSGDQEDVDIQDRASTETTRVLVDGVDLMGEWQKFVPDVPRKAYKGKLALDTKLVVQNLGNKRARGFKILLMLSDDDLLSDDDAFAGVLNVDHLGPGNERKLDWDPIVRRYVPWQGKQVIAILDAEMRVDEADEFNNTVASDELPAPDPE